MQFLTGDFVDAVLLLVDREVCPLWLFQCSINRLTASERFKSIFNPWYYSYKLSYCPILTATLLCPYYVHVLVWKYFSRGLDGGVKQKRWRNTGQFLKGGRILKSSLRVHRLLILVWGKCSIEGKDTVKSIRP